MKKSIHHENAGFMAHSKLMAKFAASTLSFFMAVLPSSAEKSSRPPKGAGIETIQVNLDNAKLLKLPAGTETIVVGNPTIADVGVQKNGIMVLTGRSIGSTNFIALDGAGVIISESIVSVGASNLPGRLLVQRGSERESYECQPQCLPTLSLGDESKHFSFVISQTSQRDGAAGQSGSSTGMKK